MTPTSSSLFPTHRELLECLTEDQLVTLEKALCSSEGLGSLSLSPPHTLSPEQAMDAPPSPPRPLSNPTDISPMATGTTSSSTSSSSLISQSNPATPNPPRRDAPSSETAPPISRSHQRSRSLGSHDLASHALDTAASRDHQGGLDLPHPRSLYPGYGEDATDTLHRPSSQEAAAAGVAEATCEMGSGSLPATREGEPFPQFEPDQPVINELPMAAPTIISLPLLPTTAAEGDKHQPVSPAASPRPLRQSRRATGGKRSGQRSRGPAGFASAEDLMHRLFVAISGVADQLQTNHAKDLRVTLKHVFAVCLSEPEEDPPQPSAAGHNKMEEEEEQQFMVRSSPNLSHTEGETSNTHCYEQYTPYGESTGNRADIHNHSLSLL